MEKIYLKPEKTNEHGHVEEETSEEDESTNTKKHPKVVDMYSILSDLDYLRA
jgi:hypothetical protein